MGAPAPEPEPKAEAEADDSATSEAEADDSATPEAEADDSAAPPPLSELELSALSEASNQMIAATANAIGTILGHEIEISAPRQHVVEGPETLDLYGQAPHMSVTTIAIAGEVCRLIQLVPAAFIVKMNQALSEIDNSGPVLDGATEATEASPPPNGLGETLAGIDLGVWVEVGRVRMTMSQALSLPLGAVVGLNERTEAPVDLMVNGHCFARGRLIITEDRRWAFVVDEVGADPRPLAFTPLHTN